MKEKLNYYYKPVMASNGGESLCMSYEYTGVSLGRLRMHID